MTDAAHILLVDDEPRIRTMLRRYLTGEGFRVSEAGNGAALRTALDQGPVDLVLLDWMIPGEDGLALARVIRQSGNVPIIMLTGKGDLIDRVVGLEAGADDYITKPFELREVLARIRSVLRRSVSAVSTAAERAVAGEVLRFLGWTLDMGRRELRQPDGGTVALTSGEFDLLAVFVQHPNRVLTRDQLLNLAKGRNWAGFDRAVDTQVARLRRKIESDPTAPGLIKTVRGGGYVFAASVTTQ